MSFQVTYDGRIIECLSVLFEQEGQTATVLLKAASGQQVVLLMNRTALDSLVANHSMTTAAEQK